MYNETDRKGETATEAYELAYSDTVRGFIDAQLGAMRNADAQLRKKLREDGRNYYLDHPLGSSLDPTALNEHLNAGGNASRKLGRSAERDRRLRTAAARAVFRQGIF